jgi:uncharacterized membrane protein YfcA
LTDPLVQGGLLFAAGLVAGTLNVIAGGGSMLTLPLMIFLGLPPNVANGTNRVAILVQNVGATSSFRRRGLVSGPWLKLAVVPTLLGAALGTLAVLRVGDLAFQRILALVMVGVTAWMLWNPLAPSEGGDALPPTGRRGLLFGVLFFLVGFYGGFIQAGVGFVILAATSLGGLDLIRSNAVKVALVLAYTPLTLVLFAWGGKVDWAMGTALAAGNLLGGLAGVHLQVLKGHRWVRGVVTVTILAFAARLLIAG